MRSPTQWEYRKLPSYLAVRALVTGLARSSLRQVQADGELTLHSTCTGPSNYTALANLTNAGLLPLMLLQVTVSTAPLSAAIITGTGTLIDSLSLAPGGSTLLSLELDPGQVSGHCKLAYY